ncbi:hypothetical protein CTI12_AA373260 [Artemisia annua]|uniref:Uncharacterized protein n=1 Tax=Artemisia annua TaxID=35608 RepID=A0A2U1MJE0_ARTAN|nr:hypothetical protein CTI12_AA373260 [Artemisia annua]
MRVYLPILVSLSRADVSEVKCKEFPLTPSFLAERVPGLGMKEAMSERKISLQNKLMVNYIQEELNLAYAYHEMTSFQNEQIFHWR